MKAETNTGAGICFDCGGSAIRLDTATGAVDCVDCGDDAIVIPREVWNVNTVQAAVTRLWAAVRSYGSDSRQAQRRRSQLQSWVGHAMEQRGQANIATTKEENDE